VDLEEGEACRCREGYVERAGRCQPEGPCGRLAAALCRSAGRDESVCGALHEGVGSADGAACERRLAAGSLDDGVSWIGEVEPMLRRENPPVYRAVLTRSLLDACGAATELLCTVLRPGERGCGADAAATSRDEGSCRSVIRGFDGTMSAVEAGADAGAGAAGADAAGLSSGDVLVRLIPDPGNEGTMPAAAFRGDLLALRDEIEACYEGARGSFSGLVGMAVYLVRIDAAGAVTVDVGRADGPIVGSGVAECVRQVLARLDFSDAPPTGGPVAIHVAFQFGR
jgi:hypothetical protein